MRKISKKEKRNKRIVIKRKEKKKKIYRKIKNERDWEWNIFLAIWRVIFWVKQSIIFGNEILVLNLKILSFQNDLKQISNNKIK